MNSMSLFSIRVKKKKERIPMEWYRIWNDESSAHKSIAEKWVFLMVTGWFQGILISYSLFHSIWINNLNVSTLFFFSFWFFFFASFFDLSRFSFGIVFLFFSERIFDEIDWLCWNPFSRLSPFWYFCVQRYKYKSKDRIFFFKY